MTIRLRTAFFMLLGILVFCFLYVERAILAPFVLGAIFAYIFNPIVSFLSSKIKLPRGISVIFIYALIIGVLIYVGTLFTARAIEESAYFSDHVQTFKEVSRQQIAVMPDFLRPYAVDLIRSIDSIKFTPTVSIIQFFPQAFSGIFNFFIFVFAGFYFLKEGRAIFDKLLNFSPKAYKLELEILFRKINAVLSEYLRGQLLLVAVMALMLFIPLEILGIRFALLLSIFSGVAELIPLVGPVLSTTAAVIAVLVSSSTAFNFSTVQMAIIVVVIFFIVRQIQDYFIAPNIMGRIVKLHPLVILFAVIAGGNLAGMLGIILAVPLAAVIRILLEFSLDKINEKDS